MNRSTLDAAMAEAQRFLDKANDLLACTEEHEATSMLFWDDPKMKAHHNKYGLDRGLSTGTYASSRRIAAVKRSCLDLRNALSDLTQGR